jgi:tRNA pseudouridine55 synthase
MNLIINLNKPAGITSQQAVTRVKRILGVKKAGHTGTLDPMATGVLLICLNEATKISRFLLDMDKTYCVRMKLGERTDTFDSDGTLTEKREVPPIERSVIEATLSRFTGPLLQKPPMYSAVKIGGQALYKLARKGLEIERPERQVQVYGMEIREISLPYVELSVTCSKGTYIRTLCDDIGATLGTGAHVVSLARERVGPFHIDNAVSPDDLVQAKDAVLNLVAHDGDNFPSADDGDEKRPSPEAFVLSIDEALGMLQEVTLSLDSYRKAMTGQPVISPEIDSLAEGMFVRLKGPEGKLFAVGRVNFPVIAIERILHL